MNPVDIIGWLLVAILSLVLLFGLFIFIFFLISIINPEMTTKALLNILNALVRLKERIEEMERRFNEEEKRNKKWH